MFDEQKRLKGIIDLGLQIAQVRDIDILLERILQEARNLTNSDAGSIYVREGDHLKFSHTQNATVQARLPAGKRLIYSTFSIPIDSHSIAGHAAVTGETVNLPEAYDLPAGVPFSFNRQYDEISGYRTKSVLAVPLKTVRGEVVGVLQLINAKDAAGRIVEFPSEDEPLLVYFANHAGLAVNHARLTRAIILRMSKMCEFHDPKETGPHVNRVGAYAVAIYELWAAKAGVPVDEIDINRDVLRMAAMLHDVGKVGISDIVLKKPARLTPEEYEIMKQHTVIGARMFSGIYSDIDEAAYIVVLNHHERWDGQGYPGRVNVEDGKPLPGLAGPDGKATGKKGEEIPLFGRIVAIADVYDALCSRRCYKPAWDKDEVVKTMREGSGTQFDPQLIEILLGNLDLIRHIGSLYPEAAGNVS